VKWLSKAGDFPQLGEIICCYMTDKPMIFKLAHSLRKTGLSGAINSRHRGLRPLAARRIKLSVNYRYFDEFIRTLRSSTMVKAILMVLFLCILTFGAVAIMWRLQTEENSKRAAAPQAVKSTQPAATPLPDKPTRPTEIPAFQSGKSLANLPPTVDPEIFAGSVRQAYWIAKEIPETLAQVPCYCKCDRSLGHKSLHTCFTDDHGSKCGTCMNEAFSAYRLQKEKKLKPERIRERIIAEYSPKS
jgi:hypothetical protein